MPDPHAHWRAYLSVLIFLFAVSAIVYFLGIRPPAWLFGNTTRKTPAAGTPASLPPDAPLPTATDLATAQHGFQYLVLYSDKGFVPSALTIKKGETVRFTDAGAEQLQVSFIGAQSPLLTHGQYWEYTFAKTGTMQYTSSNGAVGSITVK